MKLPLHPAINDKIQSMALAGANLQYTMSELPVVSANLITQLGLKDVDPNDPRFHPTEQTISYWRREAFHKHRLAKMDHVAVARLIEQHKDLSPEDNWHRQFEDKAIGQELLIVVQVSAVWVVFCVHAL